jgi:hypothetical protein
MLGHAKVIVGAPDHHLARTIRRMPDGMRKSAGKTFQIGKNPVAAPSRSWLKARSKKTL